MITLRQKKERDYFFGVGNYRNRANGCLSYNPILSQDKIIIQSNDVINYIKDNNVVYMLLIANNKGVYLTPRYQLKKVIIYDDNGKSHRTHLVKISRSQFKPYYCSKYEGHDFSCEVDFNALVELAKNQIGKVVRIIA